jgi:hypothetical protein
MAPLATSGRSMSLEVDQIDREIAMLEARRAELNKKPLRVGDKFDASLLDAEAAIDAALGRLRAKRSQAFTTSVLEGIKHGIEGPQSQPAIPAPRRILRCPHRITSKSSPRKHAESANDRMTPALQEEYKQLFEKYAARDFLERVEDEFHGYVDQVKQEGIDRPAEFSEAFYAATVLTLSRLSCEVAALAEFQRNRRIELEKRISALEKRPGFSYEGTYSADKEYNTGDFVTHDGSLHHANCKVRGIAPGDGVHWRLAVKRGRDGRDHDDRRK